MRSDRSWRLDELNVNYTSRESKRAGSGGLAFLAPRVKLPKVLYEDLRLRLKTIIKT